MCAPSFVHVLHMITCDYQQNIVTDFFENEKDFVYITMYDHEHSLFYQSTCRCQLKIHVALNYAVHSITNLTSNNSVVWSAN